METINQERFIPTLDGWRAVAIIGVLICHASIAKNDKIHAILSLGAYGVHIFFGISGFLITYKLIEEFDRTNTISIKKFFTKRVFRILPPALIYLLCIFILQYFNFITVDRTSWFGSLFFYKNFFFKDNSWYLTHFWSLSVEEQFYLFWPILLFLISIRNGLVGAIILIFLTQIFIFNGYSLSYDFILAGCALAFIVKNNKYKCYFQRLSHPLFLLLLLVIVVAGMINKISFSKYWLCWAVACMIVWTVVNHNSLLSKILEFPMLKKIGQYSYSIYLWQQLFCVMGEQHVFFKPIQTLPVNIIMTFLCAIISYTFIEKPFIKLGRRFIS